MDSLLLIGSCLRLTRLATTDDLGALWLREPVERAVRERPHLHRYADGLYCPFCVGFWVCLAGVSTYSVARRRPATLAAWRVVAGALSLNYLTGHVSARLDA